MKDFIKFEKIGSKIKALAKGTYIVETIASIIVGFIIFVYNFDETSTVLTGLIIMLCGPLVAWMSALPLYGFGELIDNVCDIERNTRGGEIK